MIRYIVILLPIIVFRTWLSLLNRCTAESRFADQNVIFTVLQSLCQFDNFNLNKFINHDNETIPWSTDPTPDAQLVCCGEMFLVAFFLHQIL